MSHFCKKFYVKLAANFAGSSVSLFYQYQHNSLGRRLIFLLMDDPWAGLHLVQELKAHIFRFY